MVTHAKRHQAESASLGSLWKGVPAIRPIQGTNYLSDIIAATRTLLLRRRLILDDQVWPWVGSREGVPSHSAANPYRTRFIQHVVSEGLPVGDVAWLERQAHLMGWRPARPKGRPRSSGRTSFDTP